MKQFVTIFSAVLFLFACENSNQHKIGHPSQHVNKTTDTTLQNQIQIDSTQVPKYTKETYTITFAEWYDKSTNVTCIVVREDSLFTIINDGSLNGNKNDTIDTGIIKTHLKTKKTILSKKPEDIHAPEIGGCSDGPRVIDLVNKIIEFC